MTTKTTAEVLERYPELRLFDDEPRPHESRDVEFLAAKTEDRVYYLLTALENAVVSKAAEEGYAIGGLDVDHLAIVAGIRAIAERHGITDLDVQAEALQRETDEELRRLDELDRQKLSAQS